MSGENVNTSMLQDEGRPEPAQVQAPQQLMCAFSTRYAACLRLAEMVIFAGERAAGFCDEHANSIFEDAGRVPEPWESDTEHARFTLNLTQTLNTFTAGRKR